MAAILCLASGIASAIPSAEALYGEHNLGGGLWKYDYTLYNTSGPIADAGYDIYWFTLNFDPPVTLSDILFPLDWDFISDNSSFIDWNSLLPGEPPIGADIPPGNLLDDFSFTSNTQLASLDFDVYLTNPVGDPVLYSGKTAPIPEPSTLILLGSVLGGMALLRKRLKVRG